MRIVFRLDATKKIGIGHMMRCMALAEELIRRKEKCYFFSMITSNELINQLKKRKIIVEKINEINTFKEEMKNLLIFCKKKKIDWVVTDHYKINSEYTKAIKNGEFKLLSIDDIAQTFYYSDIVVNQNINANNLEIEGTEHTKFLLGTKYAMIRDELLKREMKKYNDPVRKILITLGGTDKDNLTLKIIKNIEEINGEAELIVISGPYNPHYNELKKFADNASKKIDIISSPQSMLDIYLESDIAISAGGTSCYELAYFGIPNIIIAIADNQLNIAKEFDKKNVSIYLGRKEDFSSNKIKENVLKLVNDNLLRKKMAENGRSLVDGKGKKRIVDVIERYT